MKLRDAVVGILVLSVLEGYFVLQFAPHLRPTGGLGRLGLRCFLINVVLYGFYASVIYPRFISPLRHLPAPKGGNFFFGHAVKSRFGNPAGGSPRGDASRVWMEEVPNDGLIRLKEFFGQDALLLTSPEMFKSILVENTYDYEKQGRVAELLRIILGDGLILVEGDVHKFQRKHLMPSFQLKIIRELYPVFWSKACEMTQMLSDAAKEPEVELGVWCTRVTLDIIGIAGLGQDFNSLKNPEDEFVKQYNEVLEPDYQKALFFGLSLMFTARVIRALPWDVPRNLNQISENLHKFGKNLSRDRRQEFAKSSAASETEKEKRKDILSLLVKSNDFTDAELADQVLTMMAAGHETTSSTLSWCAYLLATHPEIQSELRAEIRATLPSPNDLATSTITAATVDAMPLLNAVCNETTRLYPTVPVTSRVAIRDTHLGTQFVPSGTLLFIVPWAINRLTAYWGKDAMEFRPQRWINADGTPNNTGGATSNYSIMTFLHGPRSCIGQGFARAELKCLLAALVGRYTFELTREGKSYYPDGIVTSKPANGMWMKVREVEGW